MTILFLQISLLLVKLLTEERKIEQATISCGFRDFFFKLVLLLLKLLFVCFTMKEKNESQQNRM